jgi:hypothetical protein
MLKQRIVARTYEVNTYKADQKHLHGIVNEDGSIEETGHKHVPIRYDKNLFLVVNESDKLLEEIEVDESMVDLLKAVWRHGIPTTYSCQGRKDETAWIRFESFEDAAHFCDLASDLPNEKWTLNKKREFSFPQEDIAKVTEELDKKAVTHSTMLVQLNNE